MPTPTLDNDLRLAQIGRPKFGPLPVSTATENNTQESPAPAFARRRTDDTLYGDT